VLFADWQKYINSLFARRYFSGGSKARMPKVVFKRAEDQDKWKEEIDSLVKDISQHHPVIELKELSRSLEEERQTLYGNKV